MLKRLLTSSIFIFFLFFLACSGGERKVYHHDGHIDSKIPQEPVLSHGDTPAHTAAYVCPLHCEGSGGDKAGLCSVCGLDYELRSEHISNGHTH